MQRRTEVSSGDLHHRLLNHIAVVSTNAYLLKDSSLDDDQAEIVSDIIGSMEQAHAVASELGEALNLHPDSDEGSAARESVS